MIPALWGILVCTLLACSSAPKADLAATPFRVPAENLTFEFDGREWSAGSKSREGRISREIYVLPGQTPEEWTELVTRTLTFGAQRGSNLGVLLKLKQVTLEKDCPLVKWTVLEQEARSALYEWSRPLCRDQEPQVEIGRFAFGRLGIHLLTYSAKAAEIAPGLRRQWLEALRGAKLEIRGEDGAGDATPETSATN